MQKKRIVRGVHASVLALALLAAFLSTPSADYFHPRTAEAKSRVDGAPGITHIEITDTVLQPAVTRVGMNLGEQTYYDSGMLLKNLVARNPGFEGGAYQSIVRCTRAVAAYCSDDDKDSVWPEDFWRGAEYEWITGPLEGRKGTVRGSSAAVSGSSGAVLELVDAGGGAAAKSDGPGYLIVRKDMPGDAEAGWWPHTEGGATLTAERKDLSSETQGRQALRMTANGAGELAEVASYFDSTDGKTFLRMNGKFRLSFRAKLVSGTATGLQVSVERLSQPGVSFVNQAVTLQPQWQEMHVDFDAKDAEKDGAPAAGAVRLKFDAAQATVLLDDVSLECVDGDATNMTAFRDEVVQALRELRPGVLRDMQALTLGDSVKNLLAEPMARQREGYSAWRTEATDTGYGLPEFLQLCAAVKADPWITMPATMSAREVKDLMDYLTTPVKGRAAWSAQFGVIHLEFGNETWNTIFRGASMEYPEDYGHRASVIFSAVRASKGYSAKRFDLLAGGQTGWVGRTQEILKHTEGADSLAMAPYLMHDVGEHADTAAIFGALLAEPEMFVRNGMVAQNMAAAADRKQPMAASIYEENLHSTEGTATQETLDALTPSAGAGVAMASLMMQAMRAGVKTQQLFTLGQYEFQRKDRLQVKLWGTVVDMGVTNRRRPQFLAAKLLNEAVGGAMMTTAQTGADPTWDEDSGIDGVKVDGAHELQSFAFKDGARRALVLINVSRDAALAVDFNGAVRPHGRVDMDQMRAAKITDTNEDAERVKIIHGVVPVFDAEQKLTLPACSVMVLKWSE